MSSSEWITNPNHETRIPLHKGVPFNYSGSVVTNTNGSITLTEKLPNGTTLTVNMNNGKRHGTMTSVDSKGKLQWEENYYDDTLHGTYKSWNSEGELKVSREYMHGNCIKILKGLASYI
jgi:antitoxin component YwqK of YwqJK toxin-antitoxin module